MSYIVKSPEPPCLTELNSDPSHDYSDLKGECLKITRDLLKEDQRGICAYCQRSLDHILRIEHWSPQSLSPKLSLSYSNLLGVCSGRMYLNKMEGTFISFCEDHRKDNPLIFNPLLPTHINTITYNSENRILSSKTLIHREFYAVLNLNCDYLCNERAKAFERILLRIIEEGKSLKLTKQEILKKAKLSLLNRPIEFVDFILYRLSQMIG